MASIRRNPATLMRRGEGPLTTRGGRLFALPRRSAVGHGPALLSTEASGRRRFSQETFAGSHGNGREAPLAVILLIAIEPPSPTKAVSGEGGAEKTAARDGRAHGRLVSVLSPRWPCWARVWAQESPVKPAMAMAVSAE